MVCREGWGSPQRGRGVVQVHGVEVENDVVSVRLLVSCSNNLGVSFEFDSSVEARELIRVL